METLEVALTVPKAHEAATLEALSKFPALDAECIPSAGAAGGGDLSVLVMTLGKAAVGYLAGILSALAAGQSIKLVVGQTTLEGKGLRRLDLESLLDKTLEIELKRAKQAKNDKNAVTKRQSTRKA